MISLSCREGAINGESRGVEMNDGEKNDGGWSCDGVSCFWRCRSIIAVNFAAEAPLETHENDGVSVKC
ncbi:hypothetical protein Hdeb2414_s0296g00859961 [Helianthus debilis subsp. tardiflorus]